MTYTNNSRDARYILPQFEERTANGMRNIDPYSKLFEDRIIFLSTPVDATSASDIVAQLLALNVADKDSDITLYINSTGGNLSDVSMIIDTINLISAPVSTLAIGAAASTAAMLLAAGAKGKRFALPSARIMIHQPRVQGERGQASDIRIHAQEIDYLRQRMENFLVEQTGQDLERISLDLQRDKFMSAEEAVEYGLIDRVISPQS